MAQISEFSVCAICKEPLDRPALATSGCAFPRSHRLFEYCDAPIHIDCLNDWPDRVEFSEAYYVQRYQQFRREGFWVLAEASDWFVGYIPPNQFELMLGQEDLVEVRVRDWPFVLWGHAEHWTEFLAGTWQQGQEELHGMARARAEVVVREVAKALPNTEVIVAAINRRFETLR
jgi:hypothetical protein